ncbi:heavy-metal-associated domain-containing protein [Asaia platycodi]|uniref:heavy-metal-associated domain-containing protein n=1 Tax=Asaia platycodi TaxID=610243 RepID=UPI00046EDD77|nr:heavy-metal-associated domain-containing protein [Asaia platycodi]
MSDTLHFRVEGMSCGGCSSKLEKNLTEVPGVEAVRASHETGMVDVTLGAQPVPKSVIETVIEESGFDVVRA